MEKIVFDYGHPTQSQPINIIGKLLPKNKSSISGTETYHVVKCQETVNKNFDTSKWIQLNDVIKKQRDLKIFYGLIVNDHDIVVKIGTSDTIKKEYAISQELRAIGNFIKYLCYFTCNGNINAIVSNSSICATTQLLPLGSKPGAKEGEQLVVKPQVLKPKLNTLVEPINVLLMKHYKLGSIKNYNWDLNNFQILITLIKQIFAALYIAFNTYGFIHNDTHFGNFLISKTGMKVITHNEIIPIETNGYIAIIMDFENSLKTNNIKSDGYFLLKSFQQIINNILFELNIVTNTKPIIDLIDKSIESNQMVDINHLLNLVNNLKMQDKKDPNKLTKYNPNIF